MKPLPTPLAPARSSAVVAIYTTAGIARSTALMTADDSSMVTLFTFVPSGAWLLAGVARSSRSRPLTAAAESPPETMPATTATATTLAPTPVRRGAGGGAGGWVGHPPELHDGGGAEWLGGGP
jgi:hypothetical protein